MRLRLRPVHFTYRRRVRHLARQLAPGDQPRQAMLRRLPLFQVALRGGRAIKPWTGQ